MTRSIGRTHRLVSLAAAAAALAAVGLASGCSAGQLAETSRIVAAVPGGNASWAPNPAFPDQVVQVQNATIVFNDTQGYPAGASVPLSLRVFNQTNAPITMTPGQARLVSSRGATIPTAGGTVTWVKAGASTAPSPPASPAASGAPSAAPAPSAAAAPITIPPAGFVILDPSQAQYLAVTGLPKSIGPGDVVNIDLQFVSGGLTKTVTVSANFAPPSSSPARVNASPVPSS